MIPVASRLSERAVGAARRKRLPEGCTVSSPSDANRNALSQSVHVNVKCIIRRWSNLVTYNESGHQIVYKTMYALVMNGRSKL